MAVGTEDTTLFYLFFYPGYGEGHHVRDVPVLVALVVELQDPEILVPAGLTSQLLFVGP